MRASVRKHGDRWLVQVTEQDGDRVCAGVSQRFNTQPEAMAALPELRASLAARPGVVGIEAWKGSAA